MSGNKATEINFVLFRKSLRNFFMDVKVIPGEEALQHQLLVCDMTDMPPLIKGLSLPHVKNCGNSEVLKP